MTDATATPDVKIHKFEKAGLGRAPFRFVGFEHKTYQAAHGAPVQIGGSCDYCGTGISGFCWILSSDGKRFKVGDTCVEKTGDRGLVNVTRRAVNVEKLKATHARQDTRIGAAEATLASRPDVRDLIAAQPHPKGRQGLTLLDWCRWMLDNAGRKGRTEVAKVATRYQAEIDG